MTPTNSLVTTDDDTSLMDDLWQAVGSRFVLATQSRMRRYTRGYRFGEGSAVAVVLPGSLLELWKVVQICVRENVIVIAQASNTGLTGGSTPYGEDYDRRVVVINMMRIKCLHMLDGGRQVVAFPGTTLVELEEALKPVGREPHSVIGSSCLGASVIGGVCNNSGGSLIRRGPAYTELALFARVDATGTLCLVNHLGIDLGVTPEGILSTLDNRSYSADHIDWEEPRRASDKEYVEHIRDVDSDTPARFNADARRLFEASGSAGKVIVFAVRLDTFEATKTTKVFYVGTNDASELNRIRRTMLSAFAALPIAAEYIHREAFDIAERYGKDTYLLVKALGTGTFPRLFALKSRIDGIAERFRFLPANLTDRVMQAASRLFPSHLPVRLKQFRDRFQHHLMIKVSGEGTEETRKFLSAMYPSPDGDFFECSAEEGTAAFLHRFATAGAAVRYRAVHGAEIGGLVALDIALPRNESEWMETLPPAIEKVVLRKLYYGHFFCHVFHQDYLIAKGVDWRETEHKILEVQDRRKARYPAEHNVGHLYKAEEVVSEHYRALDPCNCFNPGVGQTSKMARWR
ncbi:D-lactate dehydrogenase [Rhizobium laguerreae]|uniref:D-lactate dehydrogenase n=1 Tax=Rhizobium laguerreae TaxID=1076926 RepID=UPI0010387BAA|nr:D-lactate dehydrogenase [Rhizobium laguerreae]TBX99074.1 D-lactate dehydrogenase [Rhizobium laguerreae]